ncbi:MAG: two-component sensor histidine kinase, partial [Proteobacteria bacterium]|nr:two-component sensor histidine kinase [Pseudomonadota bacterium]
MDSRKIKRAFNALLAAIGVGLVLVALFLLSRTAQNSDDFDRLHNVILAINIAGVFVLFMLLVGNLARLLREYRTHVPGAKLKARIVGMFVGLAVLPLLVVFYFSMQFISKGIDTWFNVETEVG